MVRRNGEKKDEKRDEKEDKRDHKSKLAKGNEESKAPLGRLYTTVSHNTLVGTEEPLNTFYIDSGASDHLVPSRGDLYSGYQQLPVERFTLMVLGPCEWQRKSTV